MKSLEEFVTTIGLLYPTEHGLKHSLSIVLSGLEINRSVIITANPKAARAAEPTAAPTSERKRNGCSGTK